MIKLHIILGLIVFTAVSTFAQGTVFKGCAETACATEARIEFVRYGKRPSIYNNESDDRVWLRFVNQSKRTTLTFDAEDSERTLEFLGHINKDLDIYYEMVKKENCGSENEIVEERPVGYTRREAYYIVTLKPGQSFVFSVARQDLANTYAVYVEYSLSTRKAPGPTKILSVRRRIFLVPNYDELGEREI